LVDAAGEKAAVDNEDVTSDKAGGFGSQENGGPGQFIELSEAVHGRTQQEFPAALGAVEQPGVQVGAKDAGSDGVDADSLRSPFDRKRFGERGDGGFAGGVGGNFIQGHEGGERGNINDATVFALDHVTPKNARGTQGAGQIGVHDGVPIGLGEIHGGHALGTARGIDQDLHIAEFAKDGRGELLNAGWVGHITGMSERTAAQLADLGGGALDVVGTATGRDDVGTGLRQALGDGKSDARGPADDDGGLICQIEKWVGHV